MPRGSDKLVEIKGGLFTFQILLVARMISVTSPPLRRSRSSVDTQVIRSDPFTGREGTMQDMI
jgi:hypothetical protein